ncbi:hypothetical protein D8M04_08660 [Oceanobacillus piezotolerans]|uniref:Uncharacterized protein n=1 Tax=Oceanobacillus piezotolerans TaxID=2448030 RepID=A0A498D7W1_9BACI|nr:hypothetical protein [Oceanobacillus piezotolerans]RLL44937.1 hypothetical protein D8M04_08660 [Oceanobacillus piezotolerans]
METIPHLVWIIYLIFLFMTLVSSILYWIFRRYSAFAAISIILSLLIPLIAFVFSVQRPDNFNEFDYYVKEIQQGNYWAIFLTVGYVYLIGWFILLIVDLSVYLSSNKVVRSKSEVFWSKFISYYKRISKKWKFNKKRDVEGEKKVESK